MMLYKNTLYLFLVLLVALYVMVCAAYAQPLDNTLNTPTPEIEESSSNLNSDGNNSTDQICPEPKESLANTPSDLAKIQSDITRFTLCVQRSQLLERLNDLTLKNIESIDSILELNTIDPTLPAINDYRPVLQSDVPQIPDTLITQSQNNNQIIPAPAAPQPVASEWMIQSISGRNGKLQATLINDSDDIVYVRSGEKADSDTRITKITKTSVSVSQNGEVTTLKWAQ